MKSREPHQFRPRQEAFYQRVVALYREAGMKPPSVRFASHLIGAPPDAIRAMLRIGIERGEIAYAGEGIYFAVDTLRQLAEQLKTLPPPIKVAQVRDLTGSSRRYAAAALRWLRSQRLLA
ncbi:MAG: SelB C-terminal domain-containing protein [Armatimonadota bacterium]|nr:SelB C-terminal domain-containing protein [Armatimonadota bacterium]